MSECVCEYVYVVSCFSSSLLLIDTYTHTYTHTPYSSIQNQEDNRLHQKNRETADLSIIHTYTHTRAKVSIYG